MIISISISIVTGCLALIVTAAVAGAVVAKQDSSNALVSHQIQEIRSGQNLSSIEIQILIMESKLNSFQSSLDTFNTANNEILTELNNLESSVNALNITDNEFMTQLSSLQSSVSSLNTRVNSPVNLYQNCIQETESCTIGPRTTSTYWAWWCQTAYGPINKAVSVVCMGVDVCTYTKYLWPVLKIVIVSTAMNVKSNIFFEQTLGTSCRY